MLYQIYKLLPLPLKRLAVYLYNPKFVVGVVAAIFKDQKLLLLRKTYEGGWSLPGGMVNQDEQITDAIKRELKEELNLNAVPGRYLLIKNDTQGRKIIILVTCTVKANGKINIDNNEIVQAKYFPLSDLPADIHPAHKPFTDFLKGNPH